MAWTAADIPDLDGRTAVVTGANGGLGLETALALAGKGAHVVMAVRNQAKAADAEARIRATHPDGLAGAGRPRPRRPGLGEGGCGHDPRRTSGRSTCW